MPTRSVSRTRRLSKNVSRTRSKNRNAFNRVDLAYIYTLAIKYPKRFDKLVATLTPAQRKRIFGEYNQE
jgi:hypothetical protein